VLLDYLAASDRDGPRRPVAPARRPQCGIFAGRCMAPFEVSTGARVHYVGRPAWHPQAALIVLYYQLSSMRES
jgi:hypothetical protein